MIYDLNGIAQINEKGVATCLVCYNFGPKFLNGYLLHTIYKMNPRWNKPLYMKKYK